MYFPDLQGSNAVMLLSQQTSFPSSLCYFSNSFSPLKASSLLRLCSCLFHQLFFSSEDQDAHVADTDELAITQTFEFQLK